MPPSTATSKPSQISRAEWLWLAGAVIFGAVLRLSFPGRMAIEHFDEGVYASNFWFEAEQGGEYPARYLYAPPLLPMAIEWTMIVASLCGIRPTGFIPMLPCLLAGLVTIPSIWWVGRRWFGPTAGIVSAWLIAASDFHSSYSRAALTDVPVCLFILWGVYFLCQAMQSGTRRDVILASLFTALAWWTKYNGWLPLAIGIAGGTAWQLTASPAERQWASVSKRLLIVAGLSCVLWSPVLVGLQKHGGYQVVAANHRQYVGGITGWWSAACLQMSHAGLYDDWLGPVYAALQQTESLLKLDVLGRVLSLWILKDGTILVLFLVALLACAAASIRRWKLPTDGAPWLLLAWICGMSVATPFYHPYPRLILPWLMSVYLGGGLATQLLVNWLRSGTAATQSEARRWVPRCVEAALVAGILLSATTRCQLGVLLAWQDRGDLARFVESFADRIKAITVAAGSPADEAIVYVYGDPAIVFALKGSGLPLVGPVQNLDFMKTTPRRPTFLIRSGRAYRSEAFQIQWGDHSKDFQEIVMTFMHQSHLVTLDQPDDDLRLRVGSDESLWLGRLR